MNRSSDGELKMTLWLLPILITMLLMLAVGVWLGMLIAEPREFKA